jgi:hypothetical protein
MDDDNQPLITPYISGLAHSIIGIARPVRPTRLACRAGLFGRRVGTAGTIHICLMNGGLPSPPAPLLCSLGRAHREGRRRFDQTSKVEPLTKQEYFDTVQD